MLGFHTFVCRRSWGRLRAGGLLAGLLGFCGTPAAAGGAQDWPILHHDIRAAIDPARSWIEATDEIEMAGPPSSSKPLYLLRLRACG
jgi:hypothetical protein